MIKCVEREDGSFDISWDPNDPVESVLNTWTEQDFIDAIMAKCEEVLGTVDEVAQETTTQDDYPV